MRRGLTAMAKGRSFKERLEILVDRELRSANTGTPSRVLAEAIKLALVDNGYNRDADMRVLALWAKTAQDAPEHRCCLCPRPRASDVVVVGQDGVGALP